MDEAVVIYTDGACSGNPGPGGWGAILHYRGREKEIFGTQKNTTNNRMELQAVIEALKLLHRRTNVLLHTDSRYVEKGMSEWIFKWLKNGWKTSRKEPVKNHDLWQQLHELSQQHDIKWKWLRGHSGDVGNERADQLARKGMQLAL